MLNLDDAIRSRHSTRMFLPQKPVPRELVDEALALAQCAPSNCFFPVHGPEASARSHSRAKPTIEMRMSVS